MKQTIFLTILFTLLLALAACVQPLPAAPTGNDASAAAPTATRSTAEESPTSRVITDAAGHIVEIPLEPQRIVVVDYNAVEELLALEVMPVGILYGADDFLADSLTGVTVVGNDVGQPNLEVVLGLKPEWNEGSVIAAHLVLDELAQYLAPAKAVSFLVAPAEPLGAYKRNAQHE